jgi:hypothetical protein
MKTSYFLVLLLFLTHGFLIAQEFDNDKTSLLTSKIWKEGDEKEVTVIYKFNTDGTFFTTAIIGPELKHIFGDLSMDEMGRWEWLNWDTFTMQTTQSEMNGEMKDLNPEPYHKAVYRIQQIDRQMVKGIRYNILENEDSEYVTQFKWVVKE